MDVLRERTQALYALSAPMLATVVMTVWSNRVYADGTSNRFVKFFLAMSVVIAVLETIRFIWKRRRPTPTTKNRRVGRRDELLKGSHLPPRSIRWSWARWALAVAVGGYIIWAWPRHGGPLVAAALAPAVTQRLVGFCFLDVLSRKVVT